MDPLREDVRLEPGAAEVALAHLATAVERGLASPELLDQNEDLRAVRTLPGWPALVERAETAAATVAMAKPGGS